LYEFSFIILCAPAEIIERYRACCKALEIGPGPYSETIRTAYKRLSKVRYLENNFHPSITDIAFVQLFLVCPFG
jgi:hypothetical protein